MEAILSSFRWSENSRAGQCKQRELGDALSGRRAVYLDQKFWIILRDVAACKRNNADEVELLVLLREKVASGRAFCPISDSTFAELFKQLDRESRMATAQLIDELSLGVSLIASDERMTLELEYFVHSEGGTKHIVPMRRLVWSKLSYVLGEIHPAQTGFDEATELAVQKAFFDRMWDIPLSEVVRIIGDTMPPDMDFDTLADKLNGGNAQHACQLKSFQHTYTTELVGVLGLIAPMAAGVVCDISEQTVGRSMPRVGREWDELVRQWHSFLVKAFKKDEVKNLLRTLHINTCLYASVRWNKLQKLEANDFHDFHHAAAALGYCDVFLTERGLKSMVTASYLALDVRYDCRVAANVREALAVLGSLH
ncbi:hypothetical protein NTJ56_10305 [Burkholderia contaminans]|uniref:hypothetical protein n=1 Tax=Burkholderia contaminans TaxID=488447 RepID=UPI001CF24487|nr:hypothetical protein [Burkholderia contaminans]MCA7916802.1 hypothetical protein [Burkholderia contaminans]UUX35766.1 hypothetical protein NTJ56_10305 [Burkholderia contaminans]